MAAYRGGGRFSVELEARPETEDIIRSDLQEMFFIVDDPSINGSMLVMLSIVDFRGLTFSIAVDRYVETILPKQFEL